MGELNRMQAALRAPPLPVGDEGKQQSEKVTQEMR
eukprot:gene32743-3362_t